MGTRGLGRNKVGRGEPEKTTRKKRSSAISLSRKTRPSARRRLKTE